MTRIRATLIALTTLAALALSACGGATASPIADPKEILVKSVEAIQAAKSVHVKVDVAGKVPMSDLTALIGAFGGAAPRASGAPSPSPAAGSPSAASLDLGGTTIEGDLDLARSRAHLTLVAPTLLNLTADVIAADAAVYFKVSLLGDKYQRLGGAGASPAPSAVASLSPSPTMSVGNQLRAELDKLKSPPQKLADEHCGDTDCYHVQVSLDAAETAPLASMAPGVSGAGTLDVYVRRNDLRPSQLVLSVQSGTASGLKLTATLSGWDASLNIQAPPSDQVSESGGVSLPSFALPSIASPSP